MLTRDRFVMVDAVTREWIERHPVWREYDSEADRESILGWGVAASALAAEIERLEYCGKQPLYPVLAFDPLPDRDHLIVAARFVTANGIELPGYLLLPHAFGLFVGDREFCFNRNLPDAATHTAARLAAALSVDPRRLLPLRYTTGLRDHRGCPVEGSIEWPA